MAFVCSLYTETDLRFLLLNAFSLPTVSEFRTEARILVYLLDGLLYFF